MASLGLNGGSIEGPPLAVSVPQYDRVLRWSVGFQVFFPQLQVRMIAEKLEQCSSLANALYMYPLTFFRCMNIGYRRYRYIGDITIFSGILLTFK